MDRVTRSGHERTATREMSGKGLIGEPETKMRGLPPGAELRKNRLDVVARPARTDTVSPGKVGDVQPSQSTPPPDRILTPVRRVSKARWLSLAPEPTEPSHAIGDAGSRRDAGKDA